MKRYHEKLIFCLTLIATILISTNTFALTRHVPGDYQTIQDAIDAASNGDTVMVADGTYVGAGNKDLDFEGKAITVRSANGPANCIIDCQGSGRGFYFHTGETKSSVVSGFTITNGNTDYGGAIRCISSPTINNCRIIANTAGYSGGGIFCVLRSITITNCTIIDNTASWGGGIFISNARPEITNCTIIGNQATSGGGIYIKTAGPIIRNCVLWGDISIEHDPGGDLPSIQYCDIEDDDVSSPTIIHSDPLFVDVSNPDPAKWDLHLLPSSPCIDAGSNAAAVSIATDFDGDPRVLDGDNDGTPIVDMGADEHRGGPPPLEAAFTANPTRGPAPLTVQFTDQSTGNITSRNWDFGDHTNSSDLNPSHTYINPGQYTVSLTVSGTNKSDTETKNNYIIVKDIELVKALPWLALLLLEENEPAQWVIIMSEDFEDAFPTTSWRILGDPSWAADDYKPHSGTKSAWCARGGSWGLDPETEDYSNNMNTWMIYGPFDLSDAAEAELIFNYWLETEENSDYFILLASTNGTNFSGYQTDESTSGWVEKRFDLKSVPTLGNLCGESQVWIGFKFDSNPSVTYKGAFVDDIILRKKR